MHDEAADVVEGPARRECAVAALVSEDPMTGDDAPHAERVCAPSREPNEEGATVGHAAEEVVARREVRGQASARDGDAPHGHGGIPDEIVRGADVGPAEASRRHDGPYLADGRERGAAWIEGIVRARPAAVVAAAIVLGGGSDIGGDPRP